MNVKKGQPQPGPNYPTMSGRVHPEIYDYLIDRYGRENVCWPIIAYDLQTQQVHCILYEVNQENRVNESITKPFFGPVAFPEYRLDYNSSPRSKAPIPLGHQIPWTGPLDILAPQYQCSYEFVTKHGGLNTVDIDYAWHGSDGRSFGLETSTFYMKMNTKSYAEHLVQQVIDKRLSRKGAHHLNVLAQVASKIGIKMSLVFFNVLGHSNAILTKGYVYSIPLDTDAAQKLHSGVFVAGDYLLFSDWLSSL